MVAKVAPRDASAHRSKAIRISAPKRDRAEEDRVRIAVILSMIAPYTTSVFERMAQRGDCDLFVVYETTVEPDRRWRPQADPSVRPRRAGLMDPRSVATGRWDWRSDEVDTYQYIPRRPLRALVDFAPEAVVGAGGGIWTSLTNIVALAARRRQDWAFVPSSARTQRGQPSPPSSLGFPSEPRLRAPPDVLIVSRTAISSSGGSSSEKASTSSARFPRARARRALDRRRRSDPLGAREGRRFRSASPVSRPSQRSGAPPAVLGSRRLRRSFLVRAVGLGR
jgi:hypothetical protein